MMNTLNVPQDSASLGATAQMQAMLGRLPSRQYVNVTDLIDGYADSLW
jgi:hypothetical protein